MATPRGITCSGGYIEGNMGRGEVQWPEYVTHCMKELGIVMKETHEER